MYIIRGSITSVDDKISSCDNDRGGKASFPWEVGWVGGGGGHQCTMCSSLCNQRLHVDVLETCSLWGALATSSEF